MNCVISGNPNKMASRFSRIDRLFAFNKKTSVRMIENS